MFRGLWGPIMSAGIHYVALCKQLHQYNAIFLLKMVSLKINGCSVTKPHLCSMVNWNNDFNYNPHSDEAPVQIRPLCCYVHKLF